MTSKIKCPVCQNNLHKINIVVSTCTNDKCKLWGSSIPNLVLEALIQSQKDLEESQQATLENAQTILEIHKDLEIAIDALKRIKEPTAWGSLYQEQEIATEALETIGKHKDEK